VIDLAGAWTGHTSGCFIFLPSSLPEDQHAVFATAAQLYLNDATRQGARFAWFENPESARTGLRGAFLALSESRGEYRTDRLSLFEFRNLALLIGKNCRIELDPEAGHFTISEPETGRIAFLTPSSRLPIANDNLTIPVCGHGAGSFHFSMKLDHTEGVSDLQSLNSGLSFYHRDTRYPGTDSHHFVASQHYPLFMEEALPLTLFASLDPLRPLDSGRTYFTFTRPDDTEVPPAIPSGYRTNLGYTVHLTPHDANSRLVFSLDPGTSQIGEDIPFTLVPAGDYEITVPRYAADASQDPAHYEDNLLCGLSGVEYFKLASDQKNILSFKPGNPAYAPGFPAPTRHQAASNTPSLTSLATTSWVYLRQTGDSSPIYYAQPDQAVLYRAADRVEQESAAPVTEAPLLQYMEIPVSGLPADSRETQKAIPIVPYGSVPGDSLDDYRQLELQVLSQVRRAAIQNISESVGHGVPLAVAATSDEMVSGTTPQGILATFSRDYDVLEELVLAKDADQNLLRFTGVERSSSLRGALQSNQLFLVVSNPESIGKYFSDTKLTIQGWSFNLDPKLWHEHGTILVFKFCETSLVELVESTMMWAMPAIFNENVGAARRSLARIIRQAVAELPGDLDQSTTSENRQKYEQLAAAIRNKHWSGILAFNVPVPPASLPQELQGLAAGIDDSEFFAQFIGIESSPVRLEPDGRLSIGQSSIFALIDYQDNRVSQPNDTGYNFRVANLSVQFNNSLIKDFSSEIVVTLDRLFGERAQLVDVENRQVLLDEVSVRNDIRLQGHYESHDGQNAYAFGFTGNNRFILPDSAVLHDVEIVKAQFISSPPTDHVGYQPEEMVKSRFLFWGWLSFKCLPELDILSFGPEASSGKGKVERDGRFLSFSNLALRMGFKWGVSGDTPAFAFDPDRVQFDPIKSLARKQSLYSKFPLKLTGMASSSNGLTPDNLDYMPVKTPLRGKKPGDGWFGLTYDLELGSAGSLAGKAGIVVSLLAAWQPVGDEHLYVGLRLPGSTGGKKEISIQGVIKIVFKRIELIVSTDADDDRSYALKLKNILLKFLYLSFPPNAQTEIIIFGNPKPKYGEKTLAWYAAYAREQGPAPPKKLPEDIFT
jgi:hypothetical protein